MLELGQQDAVGHHLHAALLRGAVGEPHLVADQVTELAAELLGDPLGHAPGGDPPGLGVPDHRALARPARAPGRSSAAASSCPTRSPRRPRRPGGHGSPARCRRDGPRPAGRVGSGYAQRRHSPRLPVGGQTSCRPSGGYPVGVGVGGEGIGSPGPPSRGTCQRGIWSSRGPLRHCHRWSPGGPIGPIRWKPPGPRRSSRSPDVGQGGPGEAAEDHRGEGDGDQGAERPHPVDEPLPWRCRGSVGRQHVGRGRVRLGLRRRCRSRLGRFVAHVFMVRREPVFVLCSRHEIPDAVHRKRTAGSWTPPWRVEQSGPHEERGARPHPARRQSPARPRRRRRGEHRRAAADGAALRGLGGRGRAQRHARPWRPPRASGPMPSCST